LIGATTRAGALTLSIAGAIRLSESVGLYSTGELHSIVTRSAGLLSVPIDPEGAAEIAGRARGTPRIVNRLIKRVRDYAQIKAEGRITETLPTMP
jgi:Holliday junction DNA helicase RuvB